MDEPSAKRARTDEASATLPLRDPRLPRAPPVAVGPARPFGLGANSFQAQTAAAGGMSGMSGGLGTGSSVGSFSLSAAAGLSSSATSAQLSPAAHVELLQRQVAALTEERHALQTKRTFWREEATEQRQYAVELKAAREKDRVLIQSLQAGEGSDPALQELRDQVSKLTRDLAATSKQRELAEAAALLLQQTLKAALERQQTHEAELQSAQSGAQQLQAEVTRLQTQLEAARQHSAQQAQQLQQQLSRSQHQQPANSQQPPAHGYHSGSYPQPPPPQQQLPYQAQAPPPTGAVPYMPPSGSVPYQQPRDQHGRPNVPYLPQQQQPHAASYPAPQPQGYPQPYSQQQQQPPYHPQHHYDHPAVAELTQLQSKYETLKNDYNSLVDTYNAQKESLRTGAESLASAQRDVQTERTKVTQLSADLKRVSSQLTECEGALARAQKERDRLREECGRAKDDAARLHRNLKGMADTLERMRERAATDAKRNTQMQRTMGEQFDALLEEKAQLAAQLGILLSDSANGASSGNVSATSAPPPAHLPLHAIPRQTQVAQKLALNQKDTFSDELPPLDVLPPASDSQAPSHPPSPQPLKHESLNQSDAGAGLSLIVKRELAPASDALPATAEVEEPEEGEI